jgi:hypothetical protein
MICRCQTRQPGADDNNVNFVCHRMFETRF